MTATWLVTGGSGFVGPWLRNAIESEPACAGARIVELPHDVDVRAADALAAFVASARPDRVVHLAAQSYVPQSFADPDTTYAVNFHGTLNLLRALKAAGFSGRMLYVGSSDVYGAVPDAELPIVETQPLRPRSPYAVSKVAAEALCHQWSATEPMRIVMARPFNHIGPGQSDRFVVSGLARQITEIRSGRRLPVIDVGNTAATRDFTDVRDVVRAYVDLAERGVAGDTYNVCSGNERSIGALLDRLVALSGVNVEIRRDAARMRAAEHLRSCGSCAKLGAAVGWRPRHPLDDTLRDMIDHWQRRIEHD
jgi:GDP-4-dehydro-6-deoxy-D-mannose reductase